MAFGDLNIDLTLFFTKVVGLSTNYQMPFAICHCHADSWFSRSDGGAEKLPPSHPPIPSLSEPARNRVNS